MNVSLPLIDFISQLWGEEYPESSQLLSAGEPEGLGVHSEGYHGVAVLVQHVIGTQFKFFEPPGNKVELFVGFKQLDLDKYF